MIRLLDEYKIRGLAIKAWNATNKKERDRALYNAAQREHQEWHVSKEIEKALDRFQSSERLAVFETTKIGYVRAFITEKTAKFVEFTKNGGIRVDVDGEVITFKIQAYRPNYAVNKKRKLGVSTEL